jgi:hypothetical protein
MIRLWDTSYDGYNGGKDCTSVKWDESDSIQKFKELTYEVNRPYEGASMMVMAFKNVTSTDPWPSPIVFHDPQYDNNANMNPYIDPDHVHPIKKNDFRVFNRECYRKDYMPYHNKMPNFSNMHNTKHAGNASEENETTCNSLAFQGTMQIHTANGTGGETVTGNGHHGVDYVGAASVRAGKGIMMGSMMQATLGRIV